MHFLIKGDRTDDRLSTIAQNAATLMDAFMITNDHKKLKDATAFLKEQAGLFASAAKYHETKLIDHYIFES